MEEWLALAPERVFTVPPKIKRALAERAIREVLYNMIELEDRNPKVVAKVVFVEVDAVLAWSRRQAPKGPSLHRKVRQGPDPYAQYVARISNAWRSP
jgi:hypothetical protein